MIPIEANEAFKSYLEEQFQKVLESAAKEVDIIKTDTENLLNVLKFNMENTK